MGNDTPEAEPRRQVVRVGEESPSAHAELPVDEVMAVVRGRVRQRLREHILRHGGPRAFEDAQLFAAVEDLLCNASGVGDPNALMLPEFLGDPETWRLETAIRYKSHRAGAAARVVLFVKRRLLLPPLRWLFEYSRDNFERQRRVNHVLMACVQDLAIETARLRNDVRRLSGPAAADAREAETAGGR